MKILLDESLPRKLKKDFGLEHEVYTVRDMQYLGKKNGELPELMTNNAFELFVTVDRNLPYQQNLTKLHIIIFVFCAVNNRRETLALLIPGLFERLAAGNFQNVNEIY